MHPTSSLRMDDPALSQDGLAQLVKLKKHCRKVRKQAQIHGKAGLSSCVCFVRSLVLRQRMVQHQDGVFPDDESLPDCQGSTSDPATAAHSLCATRRERN
eukprot:3033597-Rhodomonas_salina.5